MCGLEMRRNIDISFRYRYIVLYRDATAMHDILRRNGPVYLSNIVHFKTTESSALNHHNHLGAENSLLYTPQFLGAEKLGRQCV